jgi:hypothetical protein
MKLENWTQDEAARRLALPNWSALEILAVHGNLCLALRHPENIGACRRLVIEAVHALEAVLLEADLLDEADRRRIRADSPETRKCRVCGCIDTQECSDPNHGGEPCYWIADDLCSACEGS